VIISGAGFSGACGVTFNGVPTTFTVNSDGQLIALIPTGATSGAISVTTASGTTVSAGNFVVLPGDAGRPVISQVYGAGGNVGAAYRHDFIEIYNPGSTPIDLSTYAVQYASAAGSAWQATPLSGTLLPGRYCLVQEAQGSGGTLNLPSPQIVGTINMSGTSGKVALTRTQTLLAVDNPLGVASVVDFVGYGAANVYEGTGPAPLLSSTTAALRAHRGGTDTDDNAADFTAAAPAPRNGSALDAWLARQFSEAELGQPTIAGVLANPSGDGAPNLTKYAFNLDPHRFDAPTAQQAALQLEGADRVLTLRHRRNHFAADLTYSYEVSFDLRTWVALDSPELEVVPLDSETDAVSLTVVTTAPRVFLRVTGSR
jgi:hypothetical protein